MKQYFFLIIITILAFFFRFTAVESLPPGLYIDEVSNGYNAYSILTTGKDEHGVSYPLWFKAFGEYKMPVMIYLIAGSMAILGKTELAVRLPSIVAGALTVPLLFLCLKLLVEKGKETSLKYIPYIGAAFLTVTPWHIHFSRGGFEATIALFLTLVSLLSFLLHVKKKQPIWMYGSTVTLVLTMYTYNAYRIIAIMIFIFYIVWIFSLTKKFQKLLFINVVLFFFLILPVLTFSLSPEGSERFAQTSIFSTYANKPLSEKLVLIPMDFFNNYLRYFSFEFLFAVGDQNGRHQVPGFGLFFRWESVFFLIGLFSLIKRKKDVLFYTIFLLLLIAPIPAALTIPSPHALRSLLMVIPIITIISFGLIGLITFMQKRKKLGILLVSILGIVILLEGAYYLHLYASHYTKVNILDWGGGFKATILKAKTYKNYKLIVIDRNLGDITPYIKFYDSSLPYEVITPGWQKPPELQREKVLFVRPDYKEPQKKNRIDVIRLPNANGDIFAEFYEL